MKSVKCKAQEHSKAAEFNAEKYDSQYVQCLDMRPLQRYCMWYIILECSAVYYVLLKYSALACSAILHTLCDTSHFREAFPPKKVTKLWISSVAPLPHIGVVDRLHDVLHFFKNLLKKIFCKNWLNINKKSHC